MLSSFPMKGKSILVALLIGLIVLAGVSIVQYEALNRISNKNAKLEKVAELVGKGAVYQSEYDLKYGLDFRTIQVWNDSAPRWQETHLLEPWYCAVYSLHDNCTLNISLSSLTSDSARWGMMWRGLTGLRGTHGCLLPSSSYVLYYSEHLAGSY